MYFLRWIAGYPILIILLVVGLYALYNKDNFSHWFEKNEAGVQTTELGHTGKQVASTVERTSPVVETNVEAESNSDSWLDMFKFRKTDSGTTSQPVEEEQSVASTAMTSAEAGTATTEEEEKSGSWLDIFKAKKTETASLPVTEDKTDVATEVASPAAVETARVESDKYVDQMMEAIPPMPEMKQMRPMSEPGGFPPMPEITDIPPPMEPFPEMSMEPGFAPPMDESVAIAAPAAGDNTQQDVPDTGVVVEADTAVETKDKSGSWLDIFKNKEAESEAAPSSVQTEQPVVATDVESAAEVATAKVEKEEKSGSWLDIFKREKKESTSEKSADMSGEFHPQQNESLRLAREAFWQRDFDAAEAIYTNMTKAEPNNAGLLGEYGNVLLEAGKMEQALDVYEQVAGLLIAEGRTFELRPLLYFIGDQDPERAEKIFQTMQAQ